MERRGRPAFGLVGAERLELFARTTLRPAAQGDDFVPDTSHLLLEQPEVCAAFTVEYLEQTGNAGR